MCRAQTVLVIALVAKLVCSWDIAITSRDRIEFYTIDGTKTDAVRFTSQNLTALAYDEVRDMLLYIDKQNGNDAICGYKISSQEYECYIQRNGRNIQGLAFDPVTETLFFTDTKEKSISWFSFKSGSKNNVFGNLLIKMDEGIPTDIIVDSCRRYIYWINTNLATSTIERARFDGSDREVVIKATYSLNLHSLAIDQLTQKIFWIEPQTLTQTKVYSADLNGKNWKQLVVFFSGSGDIMPFSDPNTFSFSKEILWMVDFCSPCQERVIWNFKSNNANRIFRVQTETVVGIATNYKMNDQFQGISDCKHVFNNHGPIKTVREHEGPFCVHGVKEIGQSLCKCSLGYTGERCDVTVCKNYCFQGSCSFTEDGHPVCRCNAGYTGERCEVNVCSGYCLNYGDCSLNGNSQPVCQCKGNYLGNRCEVSVCQSFCLNGNCSVSEERLPKCRCSAGYSGERCEVNVCSGYCLNNGICILNEEDEPVCECTGEYEGQRCEVPAGVNNGAGSGVESTCQCVGGHAGSEGDAGTNKSISTTSLYYLEEREKSLTLVDLLDNWRQRVCHP